MNGKTHIYMANLLMDEIKKTGKLTLPGIGSYKPPADVVDAINSHPSAFRAGAVGPDFYPDMFVGQTVIHGENSGIWITKLFEEYGKLPLNYPDRKKCYAFILGFMIHYAGDMYGHHYVNKWAKGWWEYSDNNEKMKIIARHVLVEKYMDQKLPENINAELDAPISFLQNCFFNSSLKAEYSKVPVTMPIDAMVDLEKAIVDYQNGNNIGTYDLANYFYGWVGDIRLASREWLTTWQKVAHNMNDDSHSIKEAKDALESWLDNHFLLIIGVPKGIKRFVETIGDIIAALNVLEPLKKEIEKIIFQYISSFIYVVTNKQVRNLDEALEIVEHILTEPAFYLNNGTLYPEYYVSVKLHMEMGNYGGSNDTLIQSFHAFYQCLNMSKLCLIGPDHLNGFVQTAKDNVPKRVTAIRLKAYNGQYLCAEGGGGGAVVANKAKADIWETFGILDKNEGVLMSGDVINLAAHNGAYLCAEDGGGREIVANRAAPAEWERFIIQKIQGSGEIKSGDKVALRCYNGMYICAENGGGREVIANRQNAGIWETFTIEFATVSTGLFEYEKPTYLRAVRHLRVEIATSKKKYSGTDDNVYFAVVMRDGREFEIRLDKPNYNDFESNDIDSYDFDLPQTIVLNEIARFRLRKDYIVVSDDWRPSWIKLYDDANNILFQKSIEVEIKGKTHYNMDANMGQALNQVSIDPRIISFLHSLDGKGLGPENPTNYVQWSKFQFYTNPDLRNTVYNKLFVNKCEDNLISVRLKAFNGQYVSAKDGGGGPIVANKDAADLSETFIIRSQMEGKLISGDIIYLISSNGNYACAENGGGCEVVANRTTPAEWERFIIQKVQGTGEIKSGDKVSLRCYNGMYLCAENGGGREVVANRQKVDVWETFTVEIVKTVIPFSTRGSDISKLTTWVGFDYDPIQGIFYSTLYPWQREFGYFPIYDTAAPLVGIYIQYEIIRFPYQGKQWKIELWKGQYGIAAGAEIGIYVGQLQVNTTYNTFDDRINALLAYMGDDTACAEKDNMLQMSFELRRNGQHVFTRDSSNPGTNGFKKHWWLTGFKPAVFTKASELSMDIKIVLKDLGMCRNFVSSLKALGYKDIKINEETFEVSFVFDKPKMS
ncbi:DUF4474 domain-containing protein [Alkalibaculum bacchi]|uniref:DUF4474 domain-containing protein n=1 Tax=Alkalibaculum bacchi TaxID=645887 RepID=UPI0026ECACCB|nr:DUF4474 domain-containing protein [Alkalibaculum bacchi]